LLLKQLSIFYAGFYAQFQELRLGTFHSSLSPAFGPGAARAAGRETGPLKLHVLAPYFHQRVERIFELCRYYDIAIFFVGIASFVAFIPVYAIL
jgi:hypothetical protein